VTQLTTHILEHTSKISNHAFLHKNE